MHRFYISDVSECDKGVTITGKDVNHIINVLRLKTGDEITVSNGSSRDYLCKITYLDRDDLSEVKAEIVDVFDSNAELPAEIYLFQGVPKGDKMELIIQKNVELGQLSTSIKEKTILTHHQKAVLIIQEGRHRTIRRLKHTNTLVWSSTRENGPGTGFPEVPPMVDEDMTEEIGITLRIAFKHLYLPGVHIQSEQAIAGGTYQQMIIVLLYHIVHPMGCPFSERDPLKIIVCVIISHQSHTRTYPQGTLTVDKQGRNIIATDAMGIILIVQVIGEPIAVIFVQAILCTYPDITCSILADVINRVTRQFIRSIEMSHLSHRHETLHETYRQ